MNLLKVLPSIFCQPCYYNIELKKYMIITSHFYCFRIDIRKYFCKYTEKTNIFFGLFLPSKLEIIINLFTNLLTID